MRNMKRVLLPLLVLAGISGTPAFKLASGEGLWFCENSDTHGKGNLWLNGFGRGFYWDNPTDSTGGGFPLKIFPCGGADFGLLPFADVGMSSELLSYGFKIPGNLKLRTKFTLPNNDKLRLFGAAFSATYTYNFLKEYASLGYRNQGVGFYAEGVMYGGSSLDLKLIGDVEFIRWKSYLPLKFYLNAGYRMPLDREYAYFDQYVFASGVEYRGLTTDFFLEYQMEVLHGFASPLTVHFTDGNGNHKSFPHYFIENPMYLSPGVRIRYENGITLMAAVPIMKLGGIKLSREVGYPLESIPGWKKIELQKEGKDWTDGFSPFYADWKLVGKISFPLFFRMTNAETIRKFLLMKNKKDRQVIDIDEMMDGKKKPETKPEEGKKDK
jgi:hypothetical protein